MRLIIYRLTIFTCVLIIICLLQSRPAGAASVKRLDEIRSMALVVHFVDVGVGDAILIEPPDRTQEIVIDGGDSHKYDFLQYISPYIDDPVELAVITHSDFDHWSGIASLVQKYHVLELWDPGYDRACKFAGIHAEES